MRGFLFLFLLSRNLEPVSGSCIVFNDDCAYKESPQSPCDPCTRLRSSQVAVTSLPHYGGAPCPKPYKSFYCQDTLGVEVKNVSCAEPLTCGGAFDCGAETVKGSRCLNDDEKLCDGTVDCEDTKRDEENCRGNAKEECKDTIMLPYLNQLGTGLSINGDNARAKVLDLTRFHGSCRTTQSPFIATTTEDPSGALPAAHKKQLYRLPYNVNNFNFDVKSSNGLQTQFFHSLHNFSKDHENKDTWEAHLDINANLNFEIVKLSGSLNLNFHHTKLFHSVFTGMQNTDSTLIKLGTRIEMGQFIMRDDALLLDQFFEESVNRLPLDYNPAVYTDFLKQYGIFYPHSGSLGGVYEEFYVYKASEMEENKVTKDEVEWCLDGKLSLKFDLPVLDKIPGFSTDVDGSASLKYCHERKDNNQEGVSVEQMSKSHFVNVKGGTTETAGGLGAGVQDSEEVTTQGEDDKKHKVKTIKHSHNAFTAWLKGVEANPAVLSESVKPVCSLLRFAAAENVYKKMEHCFKAMNNLLIPYSKGGCSPCLNGGESTNVNGQCYCICRPGFKGKRCGASIGATELAKYKKSMNYVMGGDEENQDGIHHRVLDVQLLQTDLTSKDGRTQISYNPPTLNKIRIGKDDFKLKGKRENIYYIKTGQEEVEPLDVNATAFHRATYTIVKLDQYLAKVSETQLALQSYGPCKPCEYHLPSHQAFRIKCIPSDFDIDESNNYIVSVIATVDEEEDNNRRPRGGGSPKLPKHLRDFIIRVTESGSRAVGFPISRPCYLDEEEVTQSLLDAGVKVSSSCGSSFFVACPSTSPEGDRRGIFIKQYSGEGKPQGLTSLRPRLGNNQGHLIQHFGQIRSLQFINGRLWLLGTNDFLVAYELSKRRQTFGKFLGALGKRDANGKLIEELVTSEHVQKESEFAEHRGKDQKELGKLKGKERKRRKKIHKHKHILSGSTPKLHTAFSVDYDDNLIIGQAYSNEDNGKGVDPDSLSYELNIVEDIFKEDWRRRFGFHAGFEAHSVLLPKYDDCQDLSIHEGKIYVLCRELEGKNPGAKDLAQSRVPSEHKAILTFEYLR